MGEKIYSDIFFFIISNQSCKNEKVVLDLVSSAQDGFAFSPHSPSKCVLFMCE